MENMLRRRSTYFLFAVVVLLFSGGAESQTPSLKVEISDPVPRVGDEVVFTCILTGLLGGTLTLEKVIVLPDQQYKKQQIAINDALVKPYKDMARFKVTKTTDGEAQTYALHISGVQIEDSGHYACFVPGTENIYALETVEVYRKPQNVSFVGHSSAGAVVVLHDLEKANLTCVVPDVLPIPSVHLLLERSAVSPKDITEQFLIASQLNVNCANNEPTCPLHLSYTMLAINRDFIPTFLHDGKELTCTAKMKQLDFDEMSSTITLSVIYPPKFVCAGLWNGTVNETDLHIVCSVYANPPSNSANKSVTIKTPGRMILLRPGDDSPEYSLKDTLQPSTDLKVTSLEFVIKTVTEEHFNYVYYLYAVNEAGNTTKEIRIEQTLTPIVDGADSLRGVNVFAVILSTFLALVFSHL